MAEDDSPRSARNSRRGGGNRKAEETEEHNKGIINVDTKGYEMDSHGRRSSLEEDRKFHVHAWYSPKGVFLTLSVHSPWGIIPSRRLIAPQERAEASASQPATRGFDSQRAAFTQVCVRRIGPCVPLSLMWDQCFCWPFTVLWFPDVSSDVTWIARSGEIESTTGIASRRTWNAM